MRERPDAGAAVRGLPIPCHEFEVIPRGCRKDFT